MEPSGVTTQINDLVTKHTHTHRGIVGLGGEGEGRGTRITSQYHKTGFTVHLAGLALYPLGVASPAFPNRWPHS